jgi:hypothetical protein
MGIDSHLSTCVGTQSPKYLEMAQGHISLSRTKGCPELLASRRSSPRQQTRWGSEGVRETGLKPRRMAVKLPGCTRGARRVRGCCECVNEGGGERVRYWAARKGGHVLAECRGCGVHGDARVVRAGGLGGTDPLGRTHRPARVGERTGSQSWRIGPAGQRQSRRVRGGSRC